MARLRDAGIIKKGRFQTPRDSIHDDFLNPCLSCAKLYKQKTAFLSVETFKLLRRGISGLVKNQGRMQLIISDQLENRELMALAEGYIQRGEKPSVEFSDKCSKELEQRLNALLTALPDEEVNAAEVLINLVTSGALDVRIAISAGRDGLFHSKKGVIIDGFGDYIVFTGSPNFTAAGYQVNYEELDVVARSWETDGAVEHVEDFDALWEGKSTASGFITVPFERRFINVIKSHPRFSHYNEIAPLDARVRGLEDAYRILRTGEALSARYNYVKLAETRFSFLPALPKVDLSQLELFQHQIDGAHQLVARLQKYGTALLGDSVGLGKTRTAGVTLRLAREQGIVKKVLILASRKLHAQWDEELREVHIDRTDYRIISKEQFLRWSHERMEEESRPFDLIVIDEAHQGLRNHRAKGWQNLAKIPHKKGLLLTATPWNNSREDVYNLFALFCRETAFEGLFAQGHRKSNRKLFCENDSIYRSVWQQLGVQRTRKMIPEVAGIYPKRSPVANKVPYSDGQTKSFASVSNRIGRLRMPYFNLIRFIDPNIELNDVVTSRHKLLLFKRAESSFFSFRRTLERFKSKTDRFRDAVREANSANEFRNFLTSWTIDKDQLLYDDDSESVWDVDDLSDDEKEKVNKLNELLEGLSDQQLMTCRSALDAALTEDSFELSRILAEFPEDGDSGKWEQVSEIVARCTQSHQKVILVSQFVDTALYVHRHLMKKFESRGIGLVTSHEKIDDHPLAPAGSGVMANGVSRTREDVLTLFSPTSKRRTEKNTKGAELNILVGTDTISVGQNLQDATVLMNVDLPYNPMVIEQRVGRIDRPRKNGASEQIQVHYFYNHAIIEAETSLRRILDQKIRSILKDQNFDSILLPGYEKLIEKIKAENPQQVLDLLAELRDASPEWHDAGARSGDNVYDQPEFTDHDKAALKRLRDAFDASLVLHNEPVVGTNGTSGSGVCIAADLEVTFFDEAGRTLTSRFVPVVLTESGTLTKSLAETEVAMQPRSIVGTHTTVDIGRVAEKLKVFDGAVEHEKAKWVEEFETYSTERARRKIQKMQNAIDTSPITLHIQHVGADNKLFQSYVGTNSELEAFIETLLQWLPTAPQDDPAFCKLLRELRTEPPSIWRRWKEIVPYISSEKVVRGETQKPTKTVEKPIAGVADVQIRLVNFQWLR